jgi:competence protein ComEA
MDGPAAWRVLEAEAASDEPSPSHGDRDHRAVHQRRPIPALLLAVAGLLAIAAFVVAAAGGHPDVAVEGAASVDLGAARSSIGSSAVSSAGALLVVDVQGAVVRPGVIRLVAGSRVADAIAAAGGYSPRVASDRLATALNLAAPLRDGDQVVVPSRDDPPATSARPVVSGSGGTAGQGPNAQLDLNSATAEELDGLPGIGPVTAAKIVAARAEQRFVSVDDLRSRKLVGASTFDKLKDLIIVR